MAADWEQVWEALPREVVDQLATAGFSRATRERYGMMFDEFDRIAKYFAGANCGLVYGSMAMVQDEEMLECTQPQVRGGTPGRILVLLRDKKLKLDRRSQFVLDECDKGLDILYIVFVSVGSSH